MSVIEAGTARGPATGAGARHEAGARSEARSDLRAGARRAAGLRQRLRGHAGWTRVLPELLLASLVTNLLGLALPLSLLQMYDRIIPNQSHATLGFLVAGVLLAVTLESLTRFLRDSVTGWMGARFEHGVSLEALRHMLGMPTQAFRRAEPGIHAERLGAPAQVRDFYSGETLAVYLDLPFVAIFLGAIALIGGWLALVPAAILAVFALLLMLQGRRLRRRIDARSLQDDRRLSFVSEVIGGIHSVKALAMEKLMCRRHERLHEVNAERGQAVARAADAANNLGASFTQLMIVGVVAAGSHAVLTGTMTPGALAASILLSVRALQPLRRSLATWMRHQNVRVARDRLAALFAEPSESDLQRPPLPEIAGEVTLRGVTLHPPGSAAALLQEVTLHVPAGSCVAIRGESGSGKTSLLNLLTGAAQPAEGEVRIDGQALDRFDPDSLHRRIAYLPQEGELVTGTILENITMFRPRLEARAQEVAQEIGLDRLVTQMRCGYETPVGDGVTETMPGGIRQRIAIARALVHDPAVILFDEANINLDLDGDAALRRYLAAQRGQRSIVLVTHRPSLLDLADRIYSLKDGHLLDDGGEAGRDDREAGARTRVEAGEPERPPFSVADAIRYFETDSDFSMCLPALLASLGWRGDGRELAEAMPHMVDSLDLSGLRNVMAELGFTSAAYPTRLDRIDPALLPCLFVPETGGAKVITGCGNDGVAIAFDSDTMGMTRLEAPEALRGAAYVFSPAESETRAPERRPWTRQLLARFRPLMGFVAGLTVISALLALAPPMFVRSVFDTVLPTGDLSLVPTLLGGVLLVLALDAALRGLRGRILGHLAARTEYLVGNGVFQRVLSLPPASVERVTLGEQIARIRTLESVRDMFQGPLMLVLADLPSILVYVTILGLINAQVLIVIAAAAVLYVILGVASYGPQRRVTLRASRLAADRSAFITETLDRLPLLRISGVGGRWLERFRALSGQAAHAEWSARRIGDTVAALAHLIGLYAGVGALAVTVLAAMAGTGSTGSVLATMIIIWRLTGPMTNGFMAAGTLIRVLTSLRQIDNLMALKGERDQDPQRRLRTEVRGAVTFSRVSFRYTMDADPALLGVSFSVKPGQVVAIAGPNGCGKSTLLKLLVRTYAPQAGSILIDDVDIRQMAPAELRTQISYMPQQCEIYYGTIAQNLLLAEPTATPAELDWAAGMAGLLDDVRALPEGWQTRISDTRAGQLPHGFRQRLSLARAFLRRAPLMLLDEPGNGLDNEGDRTFMAALDWFRGRSTVFITSHRPSHLRMADLCIYLEHGAVKAVGSYDDIKGILFHETTGS